MLCWTREVEHYHRVSNQGPQIVVDISGLGQPQLSQVSPLEAEHVPSLTTSSITSCSLQHIHGRIIRSPDSKALRSPTLGSNYLDLTDN
jgi:hypothetical protein